MANTYSALYYHLVFSTKRRERWLRDDLEERIWAYLGGIARDNKMTALQVGGIEDHVHMLVSAPPTIAPSKAAQLIKGPSSKWVHDTFPKMGAFAWQDGYGAFTVSKSHTPELIKYVQNQREHHRTRTFQEEFLMLLKRHGIEYDERYLWN
jgi:REP element-mobilizing transposase RayT